LKKAKDGRVQTSDNSHSHDEWEIDNLPNRLTLFRIALIPVILTSLYLTTCDFKWVTPYTSFLNYLAAWTFVAASITDFLDGYIARKRKLITVFGSFLDPIADKFLVVSSLIMLLGLQRIPTPLVIVLVVREMYITALRLMAGERGIKMPVGHLGKWKTTFQMIGIPLLMAFDKPWGIPMDVLGLVFIGLAALFSVYSAFEYSWNLIHKIKQARQEAQSLKQKNLKTKMSPQP
jgi:CDP-diacylglycerol--glycerol-3-phosphate 3-phosphatidyltransferase